MTDHKQIIKRLEQQNELVDTTEGQREANRLRIQWFEWLHRDKPEYTPTNATDVIMERLKDNRFTCTPASLLQG